MDMMRVTSKRMAPQSRIMIANCMIGALSAMVLSNDSTSQEVILNVTAVRKKAIFPKIVHPSLKMAVVGLR